MAIYGSVNNNLGPQSGLSLSLWLAYVFFVVYGSLVPLQYRTLPLNEAWAAFQNIPFLQLGIESRADWVANGVLYVPVGFLTAYLLVQSLQKLPRIVLFALALAFSTALAVAVEFVQLYFPQRTVSLNDVLAECVGGVLGLALFIRYANWVERLLTSLLSDPERLKLLLLEGYVFAYFAFALFPYDLLLSWPELSAKLDSSNWGWLLAGSSSSLSLPGFRLVVEVILTIPFGLLLAGGARAGRRVGYSHAALVGLLLGAFIECAQVFIASGVSQGLSVLTRVVGVCCGVAVSRYGDRWTLERAAIMLRRYTPVLTLVYLAALLGINGWFTVRWQGVNAAGVQLAEISFMPFYYHYFTSEAIALFSLGVVSLSYTPVGLLAWARARSAAFAAVVASFCAVCIESGKLFIPDIHADPTNILLAATASWFTVRLMRQLSVRTFLPESSAAIRTKKPVAQAIKTPWLGLVVCFFATGIWIGTFPAFPALVGLLLAACAVAIWHRPLWVFAVIPAALPVFDLAPWTGRYFLDEFDALLLISLAVAHARVPAFQGGRSQTDALFAIAAWLVALSFAISAILGLLPFALPDLNAFNNDYSSYNALRIVKGVLWAAVVFALSRRFAARGLDVRRPFSWGMVVGLCLTVIVVVWERAAFSDLLNFTDGYRVTGPFSSAHTGGAYVDCFLAAAIPFLIMLTMEKRHWLVKSAGMMLILAVTYALMVTFSRGGYLAFAVAVCIALLVYGINMKRLAKHWIRNTIFFAALAGAMLMVAVPIFKGDFAQSRVADANSDFGFRKARWDESLNIRDADWATAIFGMGLGRFPDTKYWRSTLDPRPGTYRLQNEAGNTYLRLDAGESIGLEQFVSLEPGHQYLLKFAVRPSRPDSRITVPICEKWLLTSADCVAPTIELGKEFGKWRTVEARVNIDRFLASPWYRKRPLKLALTYDVPQSTIDIDNVRLEAESSTNLVKNGDFSHGLDNWFFATASAIHAHWRIHSLYYGVLFDQGWLGLGALGVFLAIGLCRAAKKAWRGDELSGASFAALCGFMAGGVFDTQIDTPRFLMLLLLLAWACYYPFASSLETVAMRSREAVK